jgi:hypothetical protein
MTYCIYQHLVGEGEVVELGAFTSELAAQSAFAECVKAGPDSADDEGVELVRIVDETTECISWYSFNSTAS